MVMNLKGIKTVTFTPAALDVNIAVENDTNIQTYFLDAFSYIWAAGVGFNGTGAPTSSSPLAVIATRQYTKLITGGLGALDASGYAWTWGHNQYGNLGNNTSYPYNVPQSVVGGKRWLTLQAAEVNPGMVYVGLDYSSYAWAWGVGTNGILGNNNTINASSPVSVVGGKQWLQIAVSPQVVLGLDSFSYAWAWGNNSNGAVGDNTTTNRSSPVSVNGGRQILSVYANNGSCYGLDSQSRPVAWGYNGNYNLGDSTSSNRSSPVSIFTDLSIRCSNLIPFTSLGSTAGTGIFGFFTSTNPTLSAYSIYAWGPIAQPLTGNNSNSFSVPTVLNLPIPQLQNILKIQKFVSLQTNTTTASAAVMLDKASNPWIWSSNNAPIGTSVFENTSSAFVKPLFPQLTATSNTLIPINATRLTAIAGVTNTTNLIYALDSSSFLWGWGGPATLGEFGYYGSGTASSPVSINNVRFQTMNIVYDNSSGLDFCYGIDPSNNVWAWGSNYYGQFGTNTTNTVPSSVPNANFKQLQKVVSDGSTCWGIDTASYVWGWGYNSSWQIGDNTINNRSVAASVVGNRQALDIATCSQGVCILDRSSYAWTWGVGNYGQLGNNTVSNASSPVSVVGGRQFTAIRGGSCYFIASDASSYLWSWGYNNAGNLGDGTTGFNRSSPVSVIGGRQFILKNVFINANLSGGTNISLSSVALDASSYAWVWGQNNNGTYVGVLGLNTTTNIYSSPVSVVGGRQFAFIEIGSKGILGLINKPMPSYVATCMNATTLTGLSNVSSPIVVTIPPAYGSKYKSYYYGAYSAPQTFIKITNSGYVNPNNVNVSTTFILDQSSYAWAWGYGQGELGNLNQSVYAGGNTINTSFICSSPVSVLSGPLRSINIENAYYGCVYALDISSYAWMWGYNNSEFANNQNAYRHYAPYSLPTAKQWIKLLSDSSICCGLDSSSYVWTWGVGANGCLGYNNGNSNAGAPLSVVGGRQAIDIALTYNTCAMLDSSSYAWAWGANFYGSLGNNTTNNASSPVSVVGGRQFISLKGMPGGRDWTGGGYIAIDSSSYAWTWGVNSYGILGSNTAVNASSPVSVLGGRQFTLKNVFYNINNNGVPSAYIVALDASSYAWTWGLNNFGQLGDNTLTTRSSPVSVVGGYQFAYIEMNANGLLGVANFPNSVYFITGSNPNERFLYTDPSATFSSPVAVTTFGQQYLNYNTNTLGRTNILGK